MSGAAVSRSSLQAWRSSLEQARPFLRWAGGKQYFLTRFAQLIPDFTGSYVEPFLGSGAVFFHVMRSQLRPPRALLGDTNRGLIRCFEGVRDRPDEVYERLRVLQAGYSAASDKSRYYYDLRDSMNALAPKVDPAVFIFINRTCWNGLYRVNAEGQFNVPFGSPKSDQIIPDLDALYNCSAALAEARLRATRWENTIGAARPGDFVFLDPPYYSDLQQIDRRRATKYRKKIFSVESHEQLADSVASLAARQIKFVLTNSGEEETVELYESRGLAVDPIRIPRAINSKTDQRGAVAEIVVRPRWQVDENNLLGEETSGPGLR